MCNEKAKELLPKVFKSYWNVDCPKYLKDCRATNQELQDENSSLIDQIMKTGAELVKANAAYSHAVRALELCNDQNDPLREEIIALKVERDKCKAILESLDAGTARQRVRRALKDENPSSALWQEVDEEVNDFFRVPITLVPTDMPAYRNWFMQEVYPSLLENRGHFQYEDNGRLRSCDRDDFGAIMARDFTDKLPYTADYWDCENYVDAVKSRLARIYGVTTVRRVCSKTVDLNHAIGCFYDSSGMAWIFEAQTDSIWRYTDPGMPAIYRIENWYDYR